MSLSILISRLTWVRMAYFGDHVFVLHFALVEYLNGHADACEVVARL